MSANILNLIILGILFALPSSGLSIPKTYVYNGQDLDQTRTKVLSGDPTLSEVASLANTTAMKALSQGPYSVMQKKVTPPSGDKHDYMSLDKYYWPCNMTTPFVCNDSSRATAPPQCDQSTGLPWLRHDGCTNPAMADYDHNNMVDMTSAVINLGIGWYFTGIDAYAKHASLLLDTWFLNEATRMNPNLNFGHFIPGVTNGSHGAIIDTHNWPELMDSIAMLRLSPYWTQQQDQKLTAWFRQFVDWLRQSLLGKQESEAKNNHGVWYDVQAGFLALHVGNTEVVNNIAEKALTKRVNLQITSDGELPAEDARTKSWSYNEFCLDAFFHLAVFTNFSSVNLWDSRIKLALTWQLPYVEQKQKWPFQQIVPFLPSNGCLITAVDQCIGSYFNVMRRAANVYQDSTYEDVVKSLPGVNYQTSVFNLLIPKKY